MSLPLLSTVQYMQYFNALYTLMVAFIRYSKLSFTNSISDKLIAPSKP